MILTTNGRTLYASSDRGVAPSAVVRALTHASTVDLGDWPAALIGYDVDGRPYLDPDVDTPDPCPIEVAIAIGSPRALGTIGLAEGDVLGVRA